MRSSDGARTAWIQPARTSMTANDAASATSSMRIRRLTCFVTSAVAQLHVGRVGGRSGHGPEDVARAALDPRCGERLRELRRELGVACAQLRTLVSKVVELHVEPEHGHV